MNCNFLVSTFRNYKLYCKISSGSSFGFSRLYKLFAFILIRQRFKQQFRMSYFPILGLQYHLISPIFKYLTSLLVLQHLLCLGSYLIEKALFLLKICSNHILSIHVGVSLQICPTLCKTIYITLISVRVMIQVPMQTSGDIEKQISLLWTDSRSTACDVQKWVLKLFLHPSYPLISSPLSLLNTSIHITFESVVTHKQNVQLFERNMNRVKIKTNLISHRTT